MPDPLMHELANHEYLRTQLVEQFPDADEQTLCDTLEGLTNLYEMLATVVRSQQEDRVLSDALRARIEEMQERFRRFNHKVEKKRDLVATVMERARIDKVVAPDFTVSLRQVPRSAVILDEGVIPAEFWKPQPPKLDRKSLLEHLKDGEHVTGACLDNGGRTISVRVR